MSKSRASRTMPHPVWTSKAKVNPRNQTNKRCAADNQRLYSAKSRSDGESIVDLMNRIKEWRRRVELLTPTSTEE